MQIMYDHEIWTNCCSKGNGKHDRVILADLWSHRSDVCSLSSVRFTRASGSNSSLKRSMRIEFDMKRGAHGKRGPPRRFEHWFPHHVANPALSIIPSSSAGTRSNARGCIAFIVVVSFWYVVTCEIRQRGGHCARSQASAAGGLGTSLSHRNAVLGVRYDRKASKCD